MSELKTLPESLPGAVTSFRHGSCRCRDASGNDLLQESPHHSRTEAQAANLVGQPDTERPSAATLRMPVAAIDPPGSKRGSLALVVAYQAAMTNQTPHVPTMWTRHQLQPFHPLRPFFCRAVKTLLHDPPQFPLLLQSMGAGEWRGREFFNWRGARYPTAPVLPNYACTPPAILRWQFG